MNYEYYQILETGEFVSNKVIRLSTPNAKYSYRLNNTPGSIHYLKDILHVTPHHIDVSCEQIWVAKKVIPSDFNGLLSIYDLKFYH